jgi:hypothetical protein
MSIRYFIIVFCTAAASCTILNQPDRSLIDESYAEDAGPDGEVEGLTDGDLPDTSEPDGRFTVPPDADQPEAGDADACFDCGSDGGWDSDAATGDAGPLPVRVEDCTKVGDEDENGLADCADFACAALPRCCSTGTVDFEESWDSGFDERWNLVPGLGSASLPLVDNGWIVEFRGGGQPSGLIRQTCTPMALGVEIEARLRYASSEPDAGAGQQSYAAVVLTAALDALPGKPLDDDLAVVLDRYGYVSVTRAGSQLARTDEPYDPDHELRVIITVTPAADASSAMLAEVTVEDVDASTVGVDTLLEQRGFMSRAALVRDVDGCREVDGLLVAVQGEGDLVHAGTLKATTKQCINPSQFLDPPQAEADALSATKLGYGTWASGHVGAPSFIHNPISGGLRWDLMVEASNAAPELETWTQVGFALGHAYTTDWNAATWSGVTGAIAGNDPPSCIGQGAFCTQGASLREPSMYGVLTSTEVLDYISLVYARADELQAGSPVQYALYGYRSLDPNPAPITESDTHVILNGNDHGLQCDSLRDPHIVPVGNELDEGYWLFFTCESGSRSVYVTRITQGLKLWDPVEIEEVLSPTDLGSYAAGGVWGPEVVVTRDPGSDQTLFRIWFMARSRVDSAPVIAMAQGQASDTRRPDKFVPYDANPVLTAESAALGGPCDGFCTLRGLAITPCRGEPSRLRLLVARRLLGNNVSESQLIPLDQFWNSPWD